MLERSLTPDVVSRTAAISACEKEKHWEKALRLLQEMLRRFVTLDVVSRSAAISACEKGKHWEEALCLLQEMLRRSLTPNVVSRSAAISACEKGKHWEEADGLRGVCGAAEKECCNIVGGFWCAPGQVGASR